MQNAIRFLRLFFSGTAMKLYDICGRCSLDERELDYYKNNGIFNSDFGAETELTDGQIEILCTLSFFRKAGLSRERIATYFKSCPCEQILILRKLRGELLDAMHEKGKLIDKVDYIIYELKNKK